jgi:hypothetical protein
MNDSENLNAVRTHHQVSCLIVDVARVPADERLRSESLLDVVLLMPIGATK